MHERNNLYSNINLLSHYCLNSIITTITAWQVIQIVTIQSTVIFTQKFIFDHLQANNVIYKTHTSVWFCEKLDHQSFAWITLLPRICLRIITTTIHAVLRFQSKYNANNVQFLSFVQMIQTIVFLLKYGMLYHPRQAFLLLLWLTFLYKIHNKNVKC